MSIKVTVNQIAPSPQGLVLGLTVEGEKRSWIRFTTTVIAVSELKASERAWIYEALLKAENEIMAAEVEEPLF